MQSLLLARPEDSDAIVGILQAGFPNDLLPYTIFGCAGINAYIRDTIKNQNFGESSLYYVCIDKGEPSGFAELRRTFTTLFLNHIYVLPAARSIGMGRRLLTYGLIQTRSLNQDHLELDVFTDNRRAALWYESLGLKTSYEQSWLKLSISSLAERRDRNWISSGLSQADRLQDCYGFSQFSLQTQAATYGIGRLGESLFRSTDLSILKDSAALGALQYLDPARDLLCIGHGIALPDELTAGARKLAESRRMAGSIETVLERLKNRAGADG